jgi:hypothetical protein
LIQFESASYHRQKLDQYPDVPNPPAPQPNYDVCPSDDHAVHLLVYVMGIGSKIGEQVNYCSPNGLI